MIASKDMDIVMERKEGIKGTINIYKRKKNNIKTIITSLNCMWGMLESALLDITTFLKIILGQVFGSGSY